MANDRLVSDSILVLHAVYKAEKHVSAIIEDTGLYKEYVHQATESLHRGGFLEETKTRAHKQKKIKRLTQMGLETVKLMSDIEQIKKSHSEVKRLMVENFGIAEDLSEDMIKYKLLSRKWTPKEIDFYREFTKYALLLITESLDIMHNMLMYRYSLLLLKYNIKNRFAKQLLNRIILDALEYHISNAGDDITMRNLYYMKDNNERARVMLEGILSSIDTIEEHNPYLNRFTDKEGKNLLRLLCSMLEVPKKVIEEHISIVKSDLKLLDGDFFKEYLKKEDTHFYKGIMVKNTHKDARRKSQTKLSILEEMLGKSF